MTDKPDHEDHDLSRIYKEGAWPEPSRQIDEAILAASRRAARARRSASFAWRWAPRFALAATVVLTFTLVLRVYQEQPEMVSPTIPAKRPTADAPRPAAPAAPEPKTGSAPAPKEPAPELASRRDESTRYQSNRAQPGAAAGAARGFASEVDQARQLQQSPRTFELTSPRERESETQHESALEPRRVQESPATLMAPAAPAPSAGALSGGTVKSLTGIRASTSSALERSPQAWLEDIRKLKAQGRTEEAERELAEFKKRYPEYRLPEDLR